MKKIYLSFFCCISLLAKAQQKDSISASINLEEVSILTHKNSSHTLDHPIITADEIFSKQQEIHLIKRSQYAIDPNFRANQYEQLNVQLDGGIKAMNACPNRMDPITTHLSLNQIQEVELIKGPYSMRFGPVSGGIINLISHQSKSENGWNGELATGLQSNGLGHTTHARLGYTHNRWDFQGGYNYQTFDHYKDGQGTTIPSSYRSQDYFTKIGLSTKNLSRYEIGFQQQFGRDIAHPTLPMDTSFDDTSIIHFIGKTIIKDSKLQEIQSRAYASFVEHQMHNLNRPNAKMMQVITDVESQTIGGKIEGIWQMNQLQLYTGFDWFYLARNGQKETRNVMNTQISYNDIWQKSINTNLGLFIQGNYRLNAKHQFDFGARIDRNQLEIQHPSNLFLHVYKNLKPNDYLVSGTIGYQYLIQPHQALNFKVGRGVRTGDMIERTINLHPVGMDGANYLGNPDLLPEINYQMDLNYKNTFAINSIWLDYFSFEVNGFQSFLKNYIVAKSTQIIQNQQSNSVKQFVNIDHAYKFGFDFNWNLTFNTHWSLNGSMNAIYTKNKDWNEAIALTPPFENRINLTYRNQWMNTSLEHQYVDRQQRIATSFGEKTSTSYHLINFNSSFQIAKPIIVVFKIDNVLNRYYQSHLNFNYKNQADLPIMQRMSNPGRNFKLLIRYSF